MTRRIAAIGKPSPTSAKLLGGGCSDATLGINEFATARAGF
ncbi:hypothetical protein [Chitinolyticbacter meiyuanensis]|nr:hypothetical protein [Chitinolyticbacter meiyuanensis]